MKRQQLIRWALLNVDSAHTFLKEIFFPEEVPDNTILLENDSPVLSEDGRFLRMETRR